MLKSAKDNWQKAFEKTLERAERSQQRKFYAYYKEQSDLAIDLFLQNRVFSSENLIGLYTLDGFNNLYSGLYENIGLTFANWYAKNFDKLITKGVNPTKFKEPWTTYFRSLGIGIAANRVSGVQNTAKATAMRIFKQLAYDEEFIKEGEVVKARVLKSKFRNYNTFQARRVVRTEATNAANAATYRSAQDIFPGADMEKQWITAMDGRERSWHGEANGQTVDFDNSFIVRGEQLMWPGYVGGSAANVINCRCSMAPFPKENANTIGLIDEIGIGIAFGAAEELIS